MSYNSRYGKKPMETASRSSHTYVINDSSVQKFLKECVLPRRAEEVELPGNLLLSYNRIATNPIRNVLAVDGGYTEVFVQEDFPSATICFFQFGALFFKIEDLENIGQSAFIDPDDMAKLKKIQRMSFTLPVRNITFKGEETLTLSVRKALYEFFLTQPAEDSLIDTLEWLIFKEYMVAEGYWNLSSCPTCGEKVTLKRMDMGEDKIIPCPHCQGTIYLTDVFRLHEAIDDELGAGGILGYLVNTVEQVILAHLIRLILRLKPALLEETLLIRDGPLAFFGQTANMYNAMRGLVKFLFDNHNLYLAGLEKSGAFVEHADEISKKLDYGSILLLDNEYIYKYVLPGRVNPDRPYGSTTYYSNKLIYKSPIGGMYVVSLPTPEKVTHEFETPPRNLNVILSNIEMLKCDMYDNALIPVALANKLVSLANHPSSKILEKFATGTVTT